MLRNFLLNSKTSKDKVPTILGQRMIQYYKRTDCKEVHQIVPSNNIMDCIYSFTPLIDDERLIKATPVL